MKTIKILIATLLISFTFTSCIVDIDEPYRPTLEEVITRYNLWYIDYNSTTGTGDVPFLSKAFTISFLNGKLYANNNIVGLGFTGNGYGVEIGNYDTSLGILKVDHNIDKYYEFEVAEIADGRLKLTDNYNRVSFYLDGYVKNSFDFDAVFYDNIEYFLQEYEVWEKIEVSNGVENAFDTENFLAFTPENLKTFYSSKDELGTDIATVKWNYEGAYEIFNVDGEENLKYLTLNYDSGDIEKFDLTVVDDKTISLYHITSKTTYTFSGKGFLQYKKTNTKNVSNKGRKRTKVNRRTVDSKRNLK